MSEEWKLVDNAPYYACIRTGSMESGTGKVIADMRLVGGRFDREAANLILAAPELYEALEVMLNRYAPSYHDCVDDGLGECEICRSRTALAKARGES